MYASFQMMTQIHEISKETKLLKQEWTNSCAQRYLRILGEGMTFTIDDNQPISCIGEPVSNVDWKIRGLQTKDEHQETVKNNENMVIGNIIKQIAEPTNPTEEDTKTPYVYDEYPL